MPIYEYACQDCSKSFEYLVLGGKGPDTCPKCKSPRIKQQMSACGFHSKNSSGQTTSTSASASSCSGCSASSCAGCH
ncbi:MAG: zinc ribbon domain-containing protein [Proteobacteria bacterium]|nr:zinc ribbon domain-containing protein [Pseudomonadota bacterium]